jgi:hypothetical protein
MAGSCNKIGMATATLFFIAGITTVIVCAINSKPVASQVVEPVYRSLETVSMFDPYVE